MAHTSEHHRNHVHFLIHQYSPDVDSPASAFSAISSTVDPGWSQVVAKSPGTLVYNPDLGSRHLKSFTQRSFPQLECVFVQNCMVLNLELITFFDQPSFVVLQYTLYKGSIKPFEHSCDTKKSECFLLPQLVQSCAIRGIDLRQEVRPEAQFLSRTVQDPRCHCWLVAAGNTHDYTLLDGEIGRTSEAEAESKEEEKKGDHVVKVDVPMTDEVARVK
ncbi:hypothetical protein Tco_0419092 [Tanacetum coccineum]